MDAPKFKYKIAVSGAAVTSRCAPGALEKTQELGRLIAKRGMILVTGATTGAPQWAAKGAKEAGGFVIGISPAISEKHHVETYHLPTDYHDIIIFTGLGYANRDLWLTRAGDGVITVCGRMGTLNEFTDAFEEGKPEGVLLGTGGDTEFIKDITEKTEGDSGDKIVYDEDPGKLLDKLVAAIEAFAKMPPRPDF